MNTAKSRFFLIIVFVAFYLIPRIPSLFVKCEDWNTSKYFSAATARQVRVCIEAGADVSERHAWDGSTPLHFAAREHSVAVVRALLESGADVATLDDNGLIPLDHAAATDDPYTHGTRSEDNPVYRVLARSTPSNLILENPIRVRRWVRNLLERSRRRRSEPPSCDDWGTVEFFASASVDDVTTCLEGGAEVADRDGEVGSTVLHRATSVTEGSGCDHGSDSSRS